MEVKIKTDITEKDMFCFLINNTYRKLSGIIWIVFSLIVVGVTIYTWGDVELSNSILLIVLASLYTIINPALLYLKAKKQVRKNESFTEPLYYTLNNNGITVSQNDSTAEIKWDEIWKTVKYGSQAVIYVSTIRAFILPDRCIGDNYNTLVDITSKALGNRNHLRKKNEQ